jgi:hypothetical protein
MIKPMFVSTSTAANSRWQSAWLALRPDLVLILAPLALFFDPIFTGRALYWGTPVLQFVPWRWLAWEQLRQGFLPIWNPLNGMGAPLAANYQLALFYPPGWLSYLFAAIGGAPALAWSQGLLIALHLIWGSLGMARLARRLGLTGLGPVVAGLAFGLGGYWVGRVGFFSMIWVGAWLPWVIWAASAIAAPGRSVQAGGRWLSLSLTGCLAMMLLAGHAQLSWYTLILAGAWVLVGGSQADGWRGGLQAASRFATATALAAAIAAVQLIPTFEFLRLSQRSSAVEATFAMTYSFWPWRLLTLFAPGLFGSPASGEYAGYASFWEDHAYLGMLPLLLALVTLPRLFRRADPQRGLLRFLWAFALIALLLALGKFTPFFPLLYRWVPTFDMFQGPARYMVWPAFAWALLAGVTASQLQPVGGKRRRWLKRGVAVTVAVTFGAGLGWVLLRDIDSALIRATALAGLAALVSLILLLRMPAIEGRARQRWELVVVVWIVLDLLLAGWGLNPTAPVSLYRPSVKAAMVASELDGGRLYMPEDTEYVLKFRRFFRFADFAPLENIQNLRAVRLPNLNLLDGLSSANQFDPLVTARYAAWIEQVEAAPPEQQGEWFRRMAVAQMQQLDVESPGGLAYDPVEGGRRVEWANCARPAQDAASALALVRQGIAEGNPCPVIEGAESEGILRPSTALARIVDESPLEVVAQVNSTSDGWLILRDSVYPGWRAEVDGRPAELLAADSLFRAVPVPAGEHIVRMVYRPFSYGLGGIVTLVALLALTFVRGLNRKPA